MGDRVIPIPPSTNAGVMVLFAGSVIPRGWLVCDGSSVARAKYPTLFFAISTTFGSSDPASFNLPDFRKAIPVPGSGASPHTVVYIIKI